MAGFHILRTSLRINGLVSYVRDLRHERFEVLRDLPIKNRLTLLQKYIKLASKTVNSLKSDPHLPKKFCFICFIESPLQMMKNAFYFILKALFILEVLNFCQDFLVMLKKRTD